MKPTPKITIHGLSSAGLLVEVSPDGSRSISAVNLTVEEVASEMQEGMEEFVALLIPLLGKAMDEENDDSSGDERRKIGYTQ
ncbi:MAG: hypothetical protein KF883_01155 [Thermomicrobiales bacterium]|nr:hypothetical protein [Thermomicrobiales bacterium]